MKIIKTLMVVAACAMMSLPGLAKSDEKEGVYMFGVGAAFGDSIVYFTDVQFVEGKDMVKNSFLEARNQYSYQLENYLENVKNLPNRTCAIFFSEKKSKIEKKFLKLRKKYEGDAANSFRMLDVSEFKFQRFELE